jgi:hypothetical protein
MLYNLAVQLIAILPSSRCIPYWFFAKFLWHPSHWFISRGDVFFSMLLICFTVIFVYPDTICFLH